MSELTKDLEILENMTKVAEGQSILCRTKSVKKLEIFENTIHIYGPPKVGKSTFCAQDWMYYADCEGGLGGLEVYSDSIRSWEDFKTYGRAFLTEKHNYKAMCIDRVEVLFQLCQFYIQKKHGIEHPADLEWGKGWSLLHDEFMRPLIAISTSKYGLFTISHETEKTIKTRAGEYSKIQPSLAGSGPNSCYSLIVSIADIIIHMTYNEKGKRILEMKGDKGLVAGTRHKGFKDIDTIELPDNPDDDFPMFQKMWDEKVKGEKA